MIVIEHHQAVMAHADWIIDLGPGAGHDGGRVVFEGTPADLVASESTLTGQHLAAYVAAEPVPRKPPRRHHISSAVIADKVHYVNLTVPAALATTWALDP